jgi:MarR family transcriptional regulator, negative regulator of the multidrug operon emrRAB
MYDTYMQVENTLGALALALDDRFGRAAAERPGAGGSGAAALASLSARGAMNIERLRRILGITHSTCVRVADRLEAAALVRRGSGTDRRTVELELTISGEVVARQLSRDRGGVIAAALAPLSPTERTELERLVAKMLGALTADRTSARHICRLCDHEACTREGACPVDAAATEVER